MMGSAGAVFHLLIPGLLLYRIGLGFAIAQGTASSVQFGTMRLLPRLFGSGGRVEVQELQGNLHRMKAD
jgi:hypothetical protein